MIGAVLGQSEQASVTEGGSPRQAKVEAIWESKIEEMRADAERARAQADAERSRNQVLARGQAGQDGSAECEREGLLLGLGGWGEEIADKTLGAVGKKQTLGSCSIFLRLAATPHWGVRFRQRR